MLEAFPACPIINILSAFRNRHPTIEVKLEEGTSEENTLWGEARITGRSNQPECEQEPSVPKVRRLCEPDLFVALSPLHELAARPQLSWEDVCDEVFPFARMALGVSSAGIPGAW